MPVSLIWVALALLPTPQLRPRRAAAPAPAIRMDDEPDPPGWTEMPVFGSIGDSQPMPVLLRRGTPNSVREGICSLLEVVHRENGGCSADTRRVWDAFVLAHKLHHSQLRSSGEPYITHPLEVATILAQHRMDVASVMCGLLHDTVEDTGASTAFLAERFGAEVAVLVNGVTKFSRLEMLKLHLSREEELAGAGGGDGGRDGGMDGGGAKSKKDKKMSRAQSDSENLRKLVLAMSTDIRVLLVKLTDRLHNMRTLRFVQSESGRRRKARETLTIYAPLADRLGMSRLCHELETLAFRELQPEAYDLIVRLQTRHHYSRELQEMIREMHRLLEPRDGVWGGAWGGAWNEGAPLLTELHVQEESAYRIWREAIASGLQIDKLGLHHFFSLVLVAPSVPACYHVLGGVHAATLTPPTPPPRPPRIPIPPPTHAATGPRASTSTTRPAEMPRCVPACAARRPQPSTPSAARAARWSTTFPPHVPTITSRCTRPSSAPSGSVSG